MNFRSKYEAVLYFDGPLTKFKRAARNWQFDEYSSGLRKAHEQSMPKPDDREVIARRQFRTHLGACTWIAVRLSGFANVFGEVYET